MFQSRQWGTNLIDGIDHRFQWRRFGRILAIRVQIQLNPPQGEQQVVLEGAKWIIGATMRNHHVTSVRETCPAGRCR